MYSAKISVSVLTYNQEATIGRTLDSILAQKTDLQYQIIIGEDGSTDNTRQICEQYVKLFPDKIILLPAAKNKGLLRNLIDVYNYCDGEFITGCAGDDWWHNPNKLQMQTQYLLENETCVMVYTNYDIYQSSVNKIFHNALGGESLNPSEITDKLLQGFFLPSLTIMYRREMLDYIDLERYIKRGYLAEDLPMFLTFSQHGSIDYIDISTATYTAASGSLSHFDNARKMESFLLNMLRIKLDFIVDNPHSTKITKEELEDIYNHLLFNGAFALNDRQMAKQYATKIYKKSMKEKFKVVICSTTQIFWLYCIVKKKL